MGITSLYLLPIGSCFEIAGIDSTAFISLERQGDWWEPGRKIEVQRDDGTLHDLNPRTKVKRISEAGFLKVERREL